MSRPHALLRIARKTHLYFGVFIAPALLFFGFTGALQTFGLHEAGHGASTWKPPHWAEVLGQIHKKQTAILPVRRPAAAPQPAQEAAAGPHPRQSSEPTTVLATSAPQPAPQKSHMPLKIFFLTVSIGLFVMVLTGIYMAYKYSQSRLVITLLLIAGTVLPLALLPF